MPAFRIWASSTTSSLRDGLRGRHFGGCEHPYAAAARTSLAALEPQFGHRPAGPDASSPAWAHNDNPTKIRAARMVLARWGQHPQSDADPLGAVGKCLSPHACRFVGGWHPTPSPAICGCKPVPTPARAFHGRSVETAETLQNPCCSPARIAEKPGGGAARRRPCLVPHRLFDPAGCISVLRTRLRRSIDSPLPSPTGVRVPHAPAGAVRPLTKRRGSLWEQRGRSARARPAVRAPQKSR
jgi:hypothetical protein